MRRNRCLYRLHHVIAAEEDEFAQLYAEFYRPVFRYVLLSRGPYDVDDIVSETFRKAYLAWNGGGQRPRSPIAWLMTIARTTVVDAARRDRRRRTVPLQDHQGAAEDLLRAREVWLWFESVTRALPDSARQALYMRYASGLPSEEIAVALGMTASGVRSAISRALASIREAEREDKGE